MEIIITENSEKMASIKVVPKNRFKFNSIIIGEVIKSLVVSLSETNSYCSLFEILRSNNFLIFGEIFESDGYSFDNNIINKYNEDLEGWSIGDISKFNKKIV